MPDDPLLNGLKALPHGPGFRFIDRLVALDPGVSGQGEFLLKPDEPFLAGHFPGNPLMPGVLMAEAAAQLAGVVAQSDPVIGALPGLKLTALRNVKITGSARPGQTIQIYARTVGRLAKLIQSQAHVTVNGVTVLEAQITLSGE